MSTDRELRQRPTAKGAGSDSSDKKATTAKQPQITPQRSSFSFVDALRVIFGLAVLSTLGSYMMTRGDSLIWGYPRPWWTKPKMLKARLGPQLTLTNEQLSLYNGTDPEKPILLALNRTIYDVSASPRVYGPGGMYSTLAAKDASRSYITTCFDPVDDLVPWLGGAEEVYVPLWLSRRLDQGELDKIAPGEVMEGMGMKTLIDTVQKKIGRRKTRLMQEEAYEKARERMRAQVKTWEGMFAKKEYPIVGKVVGVDETDEKQWKDLKFCEAALKQRPPLAESLGEAMKALGRSDGKIDLSQQKRRDPNKPGMRDSFKKAGSKGKEEPSEQEKADANVEDMKKSGKRGSGDEAGKANA